MYSVKKWIFFLKLAKDNTFVIIHLKINFSWELDDDNGNIKN